MEINVEHETLTNSIDSTDKNESNEEYLHGENVFRVFEKKKKRLNELKSFQIHVSRCSDAVARLSSVSATVERRTSFIVTENFQQADQKEREAWTDNSRNFSHNQILRPKTTSADNAMA